MRASTVFKYVAFALAGLMLLLAAGLFSLTQGPGRALVTHFVDDREIRAVGTVNLSGLEGDVLSDFTIRRLTLSDDQGVWLEAEGLHVRWRARSLLGSAVRIEAVEADYIEMLRRPELEREPSSGSGDGPGLRLNALRIAELVLAEPVLGERAALQARASLTSDAPQGQSATIEVVRSDGASDRLSGEFTRSPQGVIEGRLSAEIEADSPLAQLAYAQGRGLTLNAEVSGDADAGAADFVLMIADRAGLEGQGRWDGGSWSLDADTDAEAWPDLPETVRALLQNGAVTGQGAIEPKSGQVRVTSEAGQVTLIRQDNAMLDISGTLNKDGLALVLPEVLEVSSARFDARVEPDNDDRWVAGDVQLEGVSHPQLQLEAMSANFVLGREGERIRFDLSGDGEDARWSSARAGAVLGETVEYSAAGLYERSDQRLHFDRLRVNSTGLALEGSGEVTLEPLDYDGRFTLNLDDAGRVQEGLSGPVTVRGEGGVSGLMLYVDGEELTGETAPYTLATGLSAEGRVDFADGVAVSDLDLESDYLRLTGEILRPDPERIWQGQIDYALDAEGLGVGGLSGVVAGAASLEPSEGGLAARLQAQADTLSISGTVMSDPVLRIEINPQAEGGLGGEWRFDGQTSDRTLSMAGDISWADGAGRVGVQSGRFADIAVEGEARLDAEALVVDFAARQDGAIQLWSASVEYNAARDALMDGRVDLAARLESYRMSGVTLNAANMRLSGPLESMTFELNADGAVTEPFTVSVGGPVSYGDDGLQASLDFAGELTERTLTSPQPLEIAYAGDELTARAGLALDGAGLDLDYRRDGGLTDLSYDLRAIPADLVMGLMSLPQAEGELALDGEFTRQGGAWSGQSVLGVSGLSSASEPALGALDGELRLDLTGDRADLSGVFNDTDLEIRLDLNREGAVTGLGSLLEPDWRGTLGVDGDVGVLAALYMPEGEILRGVLSVEAEIDGLDSSGQVRFRDGALQSALAGRTFEPIRADGAWRDGALIIESVQIGEGGKSGASAQAEFRATSEGLEGEGRIELNQLYLVDRPKLSGGASGFAEFSLEQRVVTVTGEADIQRLDVRPSGGGGNSIPQIEVEEVNRPDVLDRAYRRPVRIELDYHLRADDRLMVSSRAFSSEWSADVHVTGSAQQPRLSGQANLISGQASLLTAQFNLVSGRVTFDGPVAQTRLAIEARHEADDLTVIGRVEGSVRAPEVHFESTPSLPEDEILSRLLFGSGVSDLSPLQASQLAAQLSGAGWMDAMADVRATLGVDRLDVRQNADGAITVLGGRQLTEDVYLELESGVGQALGSARIEWRLNPSLVLASEVSGDSNNEISLSWRRSFD